MCTDLDDNLHRLHYILNNGLFVGGVTYHSLHALHGTLHCSIVCWGRGRGRKSEKEGERGGEGGRSGERESAQ